MIDITQVKAQPKLISIIIDDQEIIDSYGDSIEFWMYDQIDINTYFDFYRHQNERNGSDIMDTLRKIILNEQGQPALKEDERLPIDVSLLALVKINDVLGKSKTKRSEKEVGTQP